MAYNNTRRQQAEVRSTTDRQRELIEKLLSEKAVPLDLREELLRQLVVVNTTTNTSAWITILLALPKAAAARPVPAEPVHAAPAAAPAAPVTAADTGTADLLAHFGIA